MYMSWLKINRKASVAQMNWKKGKSDIQGQNCVGFYRTYKTLLPKLEEIVQENILLYEWWNEKTLHSSLDKAL